MTMANFAGPLRGIVPPLVTPLLAPDQLDFEGLERLIEHLISGGVAGLFVLGSTGEGPALASGLQRELIESACRYAGGRLPVLVGITHAAFGDAVELAKVSADAGADAVVSAGPCYFPAGPQDLRHYMQRLVEQIPLPLMLYNMPSLTKIHFDVESVRQLMDVPAIIGLKDSSADMLYFQRVLRLAPARADWTVLIGPEELTAEAVWQGAHGGVSGGANIAPGIYVELVHAAQSGDQAKLQQLQQRVLRLSHGIYGLGSSKGAYLQGVKCALSWLGICQDVLCEPFRPHGPAEREEVRRQLEALGLLASTATAETPPPALDPRASSLPRR